MYPLFLLLWWTGFVLGSTYHRTDTPDAGPAAWNFIASTEGGAVEHLRTKYLLCWVSVISSIEEDNITCFLECSEEYT